MKNLLGNLNGPKIVVGAVIIAIAVVVLMAIASGFDTTGGHGHAH
jgi:hypothetical protein